MIAYLVDLLFWATINVTKSAIFAECPRWDVAQRDEATISLSLTHNSSCTSADAAIAGAVRAGQNGGSESEKYYGSLYDGGRMTRDRLKEVDGDLEKWKTGSFSPESS